MAKRKRPEDKKHPGRGDAYTEAEIKDVVQRICTEMSRGSALCHACDKVGISSPQLFYEWMSVYPWIVESYVRAKEDRAAAEFDRLEEVEGKVLSGEIHPNAGRVVIDSMKWRLGKMNQGYSDNKHLIEVKDVSGDLEQRLNKAKEAGKKAKIEDKK